MTKYFLYDISLPMNNLLNIYVFFLLFYIAPVWASQTNPPSTINEKQKNPKEVVNNSKNHTEDQQTGNIKSQNQKDVVSFESVKKTGPSTSSGTQDSSEINMNLKNPRNIVSDNFAPSIPLDNQKTSFLGAFSKDVSWFFKKKRTKHKIGVIPVPSFNLTRNFSMGLRFFIYSSHHKGYYLAFAASKYIFHPFFRFNASYRGNHHGNFKTKSSLVYDNHYENIFGDISKSEGMNARKDKSTKLYAHRFMFDYNLLYQIPNKYFYGGLGIQAFLRQEQQNNRKQYFDDEFFLLFKALTGYDSRNNWRDPKTGAFHQLTLACKPPLENLYCKGEGDFRLYLSLLKNTSLYHSFKNSVLALRAFAGSSFFSPGSYSLVYSLGGHDFFQNLNPMRGFKHNRFRGDKMYFAQTELRFPIWQKYIDGVLFAELGEVADYDKSFEGFVMDYGGGLRFGLPPDYDLKIRFDFGAGLDKQREMNYNVIVNFLHTF